MTCFWILNNDIGQLLNNSIIQSTFHTKLQVEKKGGNTKMKKSFGFLIAIIFCTKKKNMFCIIISAFV